MSSQRPQGRLRPHASIALIAVAMLVAGGCGTTAPTPSASPSASATPSSSPVSAAPASPTSPASPVQASPASKAEIDAIYDAIEDQVAQLRGLAPKRDVTRWIIGESELRTLMTEEFDAETPPGYVEAVERLYKALDLIPADSSLRELTLDLLSGGVAGFYRNDENALYVVSKTGLPGVNERITFAHEYGHALQDQNSTVFGDQDGILDQSDRILARQAIYEGDATLLMTYWALTNFDAQEMAELVALSSDPETQALLDRMPAILRETLLFPYTTGATYIQPVQLSGGWAAVDAFYDRMPESTEQILHADAYRAEEHPVDVDLPDDLADQLGPGWSVPLEDTLGELQLGIWLRDGGVAGAGATVATAGWGGDRVAVAAGPGGSWGVVIETTWDNSAHAAEFADAAQTAIDGLSSPALISAPAGTGVTILIASDAATLLSLDVIFGATGV